MTFTLHERLAADSVEVCDFDVCKVLLMNDARYPWLILVPKRDQLTDLHQIEASEQAQVFAEITKAAEALEAIYSPFKLNVAALGNQVPQLHIHVIARQTDDDAWPGPVWGVGESTPYSSQALAQAVENVRGILA